MAADTDILPPPRDEGGACPSVRGGQPVHSWLVCGLGEGGRNEVTAAVRRQWQEVEESKKEDQKHDDFHHASEVERGRARTLFLYFVWENVVLQHSANNNNAMDPSFHSPCPFATPTAPVNLTRRGYSRDTHLPSILATLVLLLDKGTKNKAR